jgi:hypothetical protein
MDQIVQVAGALLILAAFAAAQFNRLSPHSRLYLWLNVVGALILAVLAYLEEQWGFLMLETVWTAVSAWGLLQLARGRSPDTSHA